MGRHPAIVSRQGLDLLLELGLGVEAGVVGHGPGPGVVTQGPAVTQPRVLGQAGVSVVRLDVRLGWHVLHLLKQRNKDQY